MFKKQKFPLAIFVFLMQKTEFEIHKDIIRHNFLCYLLPFISDLTVFNAAPAAVPAGIITADIPAPAPLLPLRLLCPAYRRKRFFYNSFIIISCFCCIKNIQEKEYNQ